MHLYIVRPAKLEKMWVQQCELSQRIIKLFNMEFGHVGKIHIYLNFEIENSLWQSVQNRLNSLQEALLHVYSSNVLELWQILSSLQPYKANFSSWFFRYWPELVKKNNGSGLLSCVEFTMLQEHVWASGCVTAWGKWKMQAQLYRTKWLCILRYHQTVINVLSIVSSCTLFGSIDTSSQKLELLLQKDKDCKNWFFCMDREDVLPSGMAATASATAILK